MIDIYIDLGIAGVLILIEIAILIRKSKMWSVIRDFIVVSGFGLALPLICLGFLLYWTFK